MLTPPPMERRIGRLSSEQVIRYSAAGANLARGDFGSTQELIDGWMNSAGHRANILASFGQEIGIGAAGDYYTMFIAKSL